MLSAAADCAAVALVTNTNLDVCAFAQQCLVTVASVARCFPSSRVSHRGRLPLRLSWGGGSFVREVPAFVRSSEI